MLDRDQAVAAARSWKGTPYALGQRVRGAGTDCGQLLVGYLLDIGRVKLEELPPIPHYTADWFLHDENERYLRWLMQFGALVAETICRANAGAQPGDLALFRVVRSRRFNHGAIVTKWPWGVQAQREGVREVDLTKFHLTAFRKMDLFNPWGG